MTSGQAIIESLKTEGIPYLFGLPGHAMLDVLDAMYGREDIQFICVRHEQAAALMADGYARASGNPAACIASVGPGSVNLAAGTAQAWMAHSPVIALAGGLFRDYYDRDAFQEIDLVNLFRPITKYSTQVKKADRIPEILRHAFRVATSDKKGPVFVEVPADILRETFEAEILHPGAYRAVETRNPGDPVAIDAAASLLLTAKRPAVLAGGGAVWSEAGTEAVRLADTLGAVLVNTYGHSDVLPTDHPRFLGAIGRNGPAEAAQAIHKADTLLVLGSRLSELTSYPGGEYYLSGKRIVQVEIDPKEFARIYPIDVGIVGDARAVGASLLEAIQSKSPETDRLPEWRREVEDLSSARRDRLAAERSSTPVPARAAQVYAEIRQVAPPGTIFTVDAGSASGAAYDRLQFSEPKTFLTPRAFGSLGVGFPVAMGAKLARPEKTVISMNGDGGFLFNAQEIQTAVEYGINVVAMVLNDNCWGSEKQIQKNRFDARYIAADLNNPRFDKYAELFGGKGFYCDHPDQIGDALREAMACGKPAVIEVPITGVAD
jgi:acetolactate synthase-1/2/3 large subunit/sulfoacetaldehyde acetyltransferase